MMFSSLKRMLKSLLCSLAVVFAVFAIYPLSMLVGDKAKVKTEPEKFEVFRFNRKTFEKPVKNSGAELPDLRTSSEPSGAELPELAVEAPSEYGNFEVLKSGGLRSFGRGDFAISEFEVSENFEIKFFEFSELDKVPRRISGAGVRYPKDMLARGAEGFVELSVFIDEDGRVSIDKVLSATNDSFKKAALEVLPKLLYETPTRGGKPVGAKFILPIPFKLVQ